MITGSRNACLYEQIRSKMLEVNFDNVGIFNLQLASVKFNQRCPETEKHKGRVAANEGRQAGRILQLAML